MSDMIDRDAAIAAANDAVLKYLTEDFETPPEAYIRDAIRAIPAVQVAVKPLEWEHYLSDGILTARAYGHIYRIIPKADGGFFVPELLPLHFPNQDAAKAAVQSTHERHIAHLLTAAPAPDPAQIRADALREAARTVWSEYDEKDASYWGESHGDIARREKARAILAKLKGGV